VTGRNDATGVLLLGCGWAADIHSRVLRGVRGVALYHASRDGAATPTGIGAAP